EVLFKLVEISDVFITNYRAAGIKRLGLDYQSLSKVNPKLIYAQAYGFGKEGPDAEKPAIDRAVQSRGGIRSASGEPGRPPAQILTGFADQVAASILAFGISLALLVRERTGLGQEVDTSLLGSQTWLGTHPLQNYLWSGQTSTPVARKETKTPLMNDYRCQDGKWLSLAMVDSEAYWPNLCAIMGLETLEKDPRFESPEKRAENSRELIAIFDKTFAGKPREEWEKRLSERDLGWAPVNNYADVAADPQVIANDYIVDFDHPREGSVKVVGLPVKLSKTPGKIRMAAPELGQHNEEVLLELGYSQSDIAKIRKEGIFSRLST
ncbi:CaiB/BaiF CoA transferase family protein, partial [Chloroflexota bacterium]